MTPTNPTTSTISTTGKSASHVAVGAPKTNRAPSAQKCYPNERKECKQSRGGEWVEEEGEEGGERERKRTPNNPTTPYNPNYPCTFRTKCFSNKKRGSRGS